MDECEVGCEPCCNKESVPCDEKGNNFPINQDRIKLESVIISVDGMQISVTEKDYFNMTNDRWNWEDIIRNGAILKAALLNKF